jgi:malonyl-CoA decarboxylase
MHGFETITKALERFIGGPTTKTKTAMVDNPIDEARRLVAEGAAGRGGEFAARTRAADVALFYSSADDSSRIALFEELEKIGPSMAQLMEAASTLIEADDEPKIAAEKIEKLRSALASPRERVLSGFATIPHGVEILVRMRGELLSRKESAFRGLEADLGRLLSSWFDPGLLEIRRVDWNSGASVLERLIRYEAVHPVVSWDDIRNRLAEDRRCFALFHPRMPGDPLAFVEVALTKGIAGDVSAILDVDAAENDPKDADTAIFYSITNAHEGLRGIPLGEHLIRKATGELAKELPWIKTFSTLSPIPGLVSGILSMTDEEGRTLVGGVWDEIVPLAREISAINPHRIGDPAAMARMAAGVSEFRSPIIVLAAHHLTSLDANGRPIDPVARFHLRNGGRIERLNWLGDPSPKGMRQSLGVMANYLYDPTRLERRHEMLVSERKVERSAEIDAILGAGEEPRKKSIGRRILDAGMVKRNAAKPRKNEG